MNLKKIAMLTGMLLLFVFFGMNPVEVSANEVGVLNTSVSKSDSAVSVITERVIASNSTTTAITETVTEPKKEVANKKSYTKGELRLMAAIINCEAGGESYQGKLAVGIVVMNRVKSKAFPSTIKKVIYQRGQFSPVRNGALKKKLAQYDAGKIKSQQWKSCISAAKKVLSGQRTILLKGKKKSMKGIYFFSVYLANAKFRLGGHRFK